VDLEVPRDRNGSFEPQIVRKGQTRLDGFNERIIALYARGMTTRDIRAHLWEMYDVDVTDRLRVMSREGAWDAMASLIDDDLLAEFSVEALPSSLLPEIHRRYDGVVGRVLLYQSYPSPPGLLNDIRFTQ